MLLNLTTPLGDVVVVVRVEGCASVVGFKEFLGKLLKLIKVDTVDGDSVDPVIRSESRAVKHNGANYDLIEFTHSNAIKPTSTTLLKMVSEFVSDGMLIHKSLSLTQAIQGHIIQKFRVDQAATRSGLHRLLLRGALLIQPRF